MSLIVRTTIDATVTKQSTTTTTKTAYCHYTSQRPTGTICIGNSCGYQTDLPAPTVCVGVYCPRPAVQTAAAADTATTAVQEVVKVVMATTVTVTETTFTVTSTSVTLLPTPTVTENGMLLACLAFPFECSNTNNLSQSSRLSPLYRKSQLPVASIHTHIPYPLPSRFLLCWFSVVY